MGCGSSAAKGLEAGTQGQIEALQKENEQLKQQLQSSSVPASSETVATPNRPAPEPAPADPPAKPTLRNRRMSTGEVDLTGVEQTEGPTSDDLEFDAAMFDEAIEIQDMDIPKKSRMKSSLSLPDSPPPSTNSPGSQLDRQRYRKKSVNMQLDAPSAEAVAQMSSLFNQYCNSDNAISQDILMDVLTKEYRASEVESNFILVWFDMSGNGKVSFDEYAVAMASVLKAAELTAACGIDVARDALMTQMERVIEEGGDSASERKGCIGAFLDGRPYGEEVVEEAKAALTDTLLPHMRERFDSFDQDQDGFLILQELRELLKVGYKPSSKRLNKLSRYFETDASDRTIGEEAFVHGMMNLSEDHAGYRRT